MKQIVKKISLMLFTMMFLSLLVFFAFSLIPSDPATTLLGLDASEESVQALREEMGLDQPILIQYGSWILHAVRGDFGESYSYHISVSSLLVDKVRVTFFLSFFAFFILMILSIPIGIAAAKRKGGKLDTIVLWLAQIQMAVPQFFLGIMITYFFGILLHAFTPGNYVSFNDDFIGFSRYLFFPALSIALPKTAMAVKILRTAIVDEIEKDYVRTAYSRGNDGTSVLYRHILKNAFLPFLTFVGMVLTDLLVGSIIIEQVFNVPGMGRLLLTSIAHRDYPVIQAIIVILAAFVLLINYLIEMIYPAIDPRLRKE